MTTPQNSVEQYWQLRFKQQAELLKLDNDASEHEVDAALVRATKACNEHQKLKKEAVDWEVAFHVAHKNNERIKALNAELIVELERELKWLEHIKPHIDASPSILMGFDQAEKALRAILLKVKS